MRVYQNLSPRFGRGIQRVARAIQQHAPAGVEFVPAIEQADLIIHHVIGVQNFAETPIDQLVEKLRAGGIREAVVQYCLGTTEEPSVTWWHYKVWQHCDVVWSYYDIARMQGNIEGWQAGYLYKAPLGVDPIFHVRDLLADRPKRPIFLVCTSGHIPETEGVLECVAAAKEANGRVLHLGPAKLNLGPHVTYVENIPDSQLAALYRNCEFVAGLRRVEGFELPAAEGLCSGATPVVFDQPHYRDWFGDSAVYVPERSTEIVTQAITEVFDNQGLGMDYRVDQHDVVAAQHRFNWARVVGGFWGRIAQAAHSGELRERWELEEHSPIDQLPDGAKTVPLDQRSPAESPVTDDDIPF